LMASLKNALEEIESFGEELASPVVEEVV